MKYRLCVWTAGKCVCDEMLSIHTLLGCDSTSRVSSTDKGAALTKFSAGYTQSCKVRKKDLTYTHKIGAGKKKIENFSRSTQVMNQHQQVCSSWLDVAAKTTAVNEPVLVVDLIWNCQIYAENV